MKFAISSLAALAMVAALWTSAAQAQKADSNSVDGTFVSAAAGKVTISAADGKESSHTLAATAKYTVDGKAAKLEDFKKGMKVRATTDRSGSVTALSSGAVAAKETTRTRK